MATKTILFVTYARLATAKLIYHEPQNQSLVDSYKNEAQQVLNQIINIRLNPDERQKISSTKYGNWYTTVDDKEVAYMILATKDYPERYAYEYAGKIRDQLRKMGDYSTEDEASLRFNSKDLVKELFKRYADLKSVSGIDQAQSKVDEIKIEMGNNIGKMLDNQQNLTELSDKSDKLKMQSQVFEKQSKDLERIMYWRKIKLNIIIGLVILGILAYVVLPIIIKMSKS